MSYNWQNGELITAEKLNQTGDAGFECTESRTTLLEETVTTVELQGQCSAKLSYTRFVKEPSITITINGTEYTCQDNSTDPSDGMYGAPFGPGGADFSTYPFAFISTETRDGYDNVLVTQTEGIYTIKVETVTTSVTITECFRKAVEDIGSGNSYAIHVTVGEETAEGVYSCTVAESISDIRNAVEQGKFVFAIISDGEGSTYTLYLESTTPTSINLRSPLGDPNYSAPTSSDLACVQLIGVKLPDDDSYEWLFQNWRFASR